LEHHADVAPMHRDVVHVLPVDQAFPLVEIDEAGDGAQQGGLAAAARPEQAEELAFPEGDRYGSERRHAAVAFRRVAYVDRAHRSTRKRYSWGIISMLPMESRMMMVETALISGVKPLRIAE